MLKKLPSDKINDPKNALFLFLFYGIFHFRFRFVFNTVYIFVQQNAWTIGLLNVIIPFKIKIIEKPHTVLLPDL